jgi:hypothetical protein
LSTDRLALNTLGASNGVEAGKLVFRNVASNEGASLDLTVTDASGAEDYKDQGYSAFQQDQRKYTGAYKDAGRIAFDKNGKFVFRFKLTVSGTGANATLPLFPVTFYDIDGKGEMLTACNVAGVIKDPNSDLVERQDEPCYHHFAYGREVNLPADFEHLTQNQAKQTVTYVYRNSGEWDIRVALMQEEEDRYIVFKSSKVLACDNAVKAWSDDWKNNGKQADA